MDPVKPRIATVWLGGCSGCHMSFLDLDERLIDLAQRVELCYSPIADVKAFPRGVDITLVEGAVVNRDHVEELRHIRRHTKVLVAFGDCAVTGNVTSMRNPLPVASVLAASYGATTMSAEVPELLPRSRPLHELVTVDHFLPGCPPSAERIHELLWSLLGHWQGGGEKRFG